MGAQAPTSETPSTEYPNQHRPHPAGAATLLPVRVSKPEGRTAKWQYTNRGARTRRRNSWQTHENCGIARKFPASYKYVTTGPLLQLASEVYMNALKGNSIYVHKDMSERDYELRHRYLAAATASADALLGEITFCYELVDDGNNFFRNKEEYERTFQTWTTLANNALSRLRGVMDSDKRRWNGYMRDRKAKTP